MRQSPFDTRRSATVMLLIALVAAFFLEIIVERICGHNPIDRYFMLSRSGLAHGFVWQLLTFQFMHAGILHLFFNCWAIYIFGQDVEMTLGRRSFWTLYLSSGVLGGLAQALVGVAGMPGFSDDVPVVGASAGALGLAAAFAVLFPNRVFLLFFVLPIRAKWLVGGFGVVAVYGMFAPFDGTANVAHVGGMLTGLLFIRYAVHWQWPQLGRLRRPASQRLVKVQFQKGGFWPRSRHIPEEDLPPEEFVSREVDPILDKISAHGINSLTERERRILEAARAKIANR